MGFMKGFSDGINGKKRENMQKELREIVKSITPMEKILELKI